MQPGFNKDIKEEKEEKKEEEVVKEEEESDEDLNEKDNKNEGVKLVNPTIKLEPYEPLEEKNGF